MTQRRSVEGLDAKGKKKKMKNKDIKIAAAAFAELTDEDWCTTRVNECALLLGEFCWRCATKSSHEDGRERCGI